MNEDKNEIEKNEINFWWTVEFSMIPSDNRSLDEERLETIATISNSIGSYIFTEYFTGNKTRLFLRADYNASRNLDEIIFELDVILKQFEDIIITRCYKTENQDWTVQNLDAFPPLNVGRSLVVMAPWHKKKEIQPGRIPIYIYPASAFGTGYHESTRIALDLLEDIVKTGDTILDIGTGTGILFIAAIKLGADRAVARDIDPATLEEARRNMNLNGINPNICDLSVGDLLKGVKMQANILTANILLQPNLAMLPDVKDVLKPSGFAIFSGMTNVEKAAFLSVLTASKLDVEKELRFGDWWGCRAVKAWG